MREGIRKKEVYFNLIFFRFQFYSLFYWFWDVFYEMFRGELKFYGFFIVFKGLVNSSNDYIVLVDIGFLDFINGVIRVLIQILCCRDLSSGVISDNQCDFFLFIQEEELRLQKVSVFVFIFFDGQLR